MSGAVSARGEETLTSVRVQTPDAESGRGSRQKMSPGSVRREASFATNPTPELANAGSFGLCDIFSGQDRTRRPNSAPVDQRQLDAMTPTPMPKEEDQVHIAVSPNTRLTKSPVGSGTVTSPEHGTYHHPEPRRPHQSQMLANLLEEALPPNSPEPPKRAASAQAGGLLANARAPSVATPSGVQQVLGKNQGGEQFTPTPPPDHGVSGGGEEWADSPHAPAGPHRSVQNTPEPMSQYYGYYGMGGRLGHDHLRGPAYEGFPITTPSPNMLAGAAGPPYGYPPLVGMPPRFPQAHEAAGIPGMMAGHIGSSASQPSLLRPHGPHSAAPQQPGISELAQVTSACLGFNTPYSSGLYADSMDVHSIVAQARSLNSGDSRQQQSQQGLMQQSYQQSYQQALQQSGAGRGSWPMPNCPFTVGFPPAVQGLGASLPLLSQPSSGGCGLSAQPLAAGPLASASGTPSEATAYSFARSSEAQQRQEAPARGQHASQGGGSQAVGSRAAQQEQGLDAGPSLLTSSSSTAKAYGRPNSLKSQADVQGISGPLPPEINELTDQVAALAKTQAGSKYLQRQLLRGHPVVVNLILEEIQQDVVQLMCDAYGNYLCSQAFQACSVQQRKRLLENLSPRAAATACDKRGTHALQTLIGLLTTPDEQQIMMRAIAPHVIELCMDQNGTHVVKSILFCFMPPFNDFVHLAVIERLSEVANHMHGLCVLKKCISQAKSRGRHQDMLLQKLNEHALDLVQSQYGNYAIQHAFEEWGGPTCTSIMLKLEGRMMQLSIQKFSSNVVEKIFVLAPPDMRRRFIDELVHVDKMQILLTSNYGSYVVTRALQLADLGQAEALLESISNNLNQLSDNMPSNRRLKTKWAKVMKHGTERFAGVSFDISSTVKPTKIAHNGGAAHVSARDWFSSGPLPGHGLAGSIPDLDKGEGYNQARPLNSAWPANRPVFAGAAISATGFGPSPISLQPPVWGNWEAHSNS